MRDIRTFALLFYIFAICTILVAGDEEEAKFESGVNSLCIGHSFFVWIYREMNQYVDLKKYPDHGFQDVFRGGNGGSPGSLWKNDKQKVKSYLKTGDIDLLMMTLHEDNLQDDEEDVVEDFRRWIDLARSYNSNTSFFIGIPWATRGPEKTTNDYNSEIESYDGLSLSIVEKLRDQYQDTSIYFLNYGHVAARMRVLFDQGSLEDVQQLCCTREDSIFRDEIPGHQGDMLRDIAALYWLKFFYGDASVTLHEYNTSAVDDIISYAQSKNIDSNVQTFISNPNPKPNPKPNENFSNSEKETMKEKMTIREILELLFSK